MMNKKKLISFSVLVLTMLVGAVGLYSVKLRYAPKSNGDVRDTPPTTYAAPDAQPSQPRYETTAPVFENDAAQTEPSLALVTVSETAAPTETQIGTEAQTVNTTLPRPEYFDIPLGMDIALDYSNAEPVFSATMGDWRTHNGIDFAGVVGDPVKACAAGFVSAVYDDPLYGTVIEIEHGGGIVAKYCGVGKGSTIPVGAEVKMDDTVAYLGVVPCESEDGAHLHFEMTENGKTIDPLTVLEMP